MVVEPHVPCCYLEDSEWADVLITRRCRNVLLSRGFTTKEQIRSLGRTGILRWGRVGSKTVIEIGRLIGEDWSG